MTSPNQSVTPKVKDETENPKSLATSLMKNYSDRIPVIIEKETSSNLPQIEKKKYLVPHSMTMGAFIVTIRRKIKLDSYQSLFIQTKEGNFTPPSSMLLSEIYEKYQSSDKFLYLIYRSENAFGA